MLKPLQGLVGVAATLSLMGMPGTAAAADRQADAGPMISYHNPETLPRWDFSYGATFESWLEPITLKRIYPTDRSTSMKAQARSAFKQLAATLEEMGAEDLYVVGIDLVFASKGLTSEESLDALADLSDVRRAFFQPRVNYGPKAQGFSDYPVSSVLGVDTLGRDGVMMAMDVTLANVHEQTYAEMLTPQKRMARIRGAGAERRMMIGNVTAMQQNFMIKGYGDLSAEVTAALENFAAVVKDAGGSMADIDSLTVHYVPEGLRVLAGAGEPRQVASRRANMGADRAKLALARDAGSEKVISRAIADFMTREIGSAFDADAVTMKMEPVRVACGVQELGVSLEGTGIIAN
ncbi:RidA family protein [Rhodothalassium salexigens]|uniref:RidA family protein n=1 Tax=Rhodothalassium salexigens TaxID=1086 RepID=UPI00191333C6|nr:RidA family protein [Rhodothalassium salexigens]